MPASKQYSAILTANQARIGIFPANDRRVGLIIQNTGVNPVLLRFENEVQQDGGDFELAAGESLTWTDRFAPIERLSALSILGTTLAIMETIQ